MSVDRRQARALAQSYIRRGDPLGWFEPLYTTADRDPSIIPWADLTPNPSLIEWLDAQNIDGRGKRAIKVGCGLGDDAEELLRRGFEVLAFDIAPTAITWCRERFPNSRVKYEVADLFETPTEWAHEFDLVLESYTLQVLPPMFRDRAMDQICRLVAFGGVLLVICRGRDAGDEAGEMPWPLSRRELARFELCGLKEASFDDYLDNEDPPVRRFQAVYRRFV